MPKINVYLPDDLAEAVRQTGVPVSAVCQRALEQAVRRVTAIRETDLGDLDDASLAARLPHFTARARSVLALAAKEAHDTGSPAVGTGHLLGGMLREGANMALQVLRAMEIEPELVARELARRPLVESTVVEHGSRRFSTAAANALELAVTEATALGHNYVGCEHLLLGLIAEPDGAGGDALRTMGAELRATRRAVSAALAGYLHLRAQTEQDGAAQTLAGITAAIGQQLAPLVQRIERLEERLAAGQQS